MPDFTCLAATGAQVHVLAFPIHLFPCTVPESRSLSALYSHVRAEQDRLKLKGKASGMTSCKTSCLGPCSLAPVIQVWPEGTIYGGVTEEDVDRIIDSHIEKGEPVEDIAYLPTGKKQSLK